MSKQRAAMTDAERKAAERARYKRAGLTLFTVAVHPDDREALRRFAEKLGERRSK